MQFTLEKSEIKAFQDVIGSYETNLELEVRFGVFTNVDKGMVNGVRNNSCKRFVSGVEANSYMTAFNYYACYGWPVEETNAIEECGFDPPFDDVRRGNDGKMIRKTKLKILDVPAFGIRIALNREQNVDSSINTGTGNTKRHKRRTSYISPQFIRYDFTVVTLEDGRRVYEIELEWIGAIDNVDNMLTVLHQHIQTMLQVLNQSYILTSSSILQSVSREYQFLVGARHAKQFIGALPKTLRRKDVSTLHSVVYSVSRKFDGQRALLFIDKGGWIWKIYRTMRIVSCGLISKTIRSVILDGEITNVHGKETFWAFDLIVNDGQDVRGNTAWSMQVRWEKAMTIVENLSTTAEMTEQAKGAESLIKIKIKPVVWSISNIDELLELPHGVNADGYIFTPLHEPYSVNLFWNNQFKWKNVSDQTIDVILETNGNVFVNDGNGIVRFEAYPSIPIDSKFIIEPGMIVECGWDITTNDFKINKIRNDKTTPNHINVALDVIDAIKNPVSLSMIHGSSRFGYKTAVKKVEESIGMTFNSFDISKAFKSKNDLELYFKQILENMKDEDVFALTFVDGAALANMLITSDCMWQVIEDWGDNDHGLLSGIQVTSEQGWTSLQELHKSPYGVSYIETLFDLEVRRTPGPDFGFASNKVVNRSNLIFTDVMISTALEFDLHIVGLQFMSDALPDIFLQLLDESERLRFSLQRVAIFQLRSTGQQTNYVTLDDTWIGVPKDILEAVNSCNNIACAHFDKGVFHFTTQVPDKWSFMKVIVNYEGKEMALARKKDKEWILVHPKELLITPVVVKPQPENLLKMNVESLREFAASKQITIPSKIRRKEEIRQFIETKL
jgi:hypothetical protein